MCINQGTEWSISLEQPVGSIGTEGTPGIPLRGLNARWARTQISITVDSPVSSRGHPRPHTWLLGGTTIWLQTTPCEVLVCPAFVFPAPFASGDWNEWTRARERRFRNLKLSFYASGFPANLFKRWRVRSAAPFLSAIPSLCSCVSPSRAWEITGCAWPALLLGTSLATLRGSLIFVEKGFSLSNHRPP